MWVRESQQSATELWLCYRMPPRRLNPADPAVEYSDDDSEDRDYADGDNIVPETGEVPEVQAEADPDPLGRGRRRALREARRGEPSVHASSIVNELTSMTLDTRERPSEDTRDHSGGRRGQSGAASIAKSPPPKWDFDKEPFFTYKRKITIWAESHKIDHLLTQRPRRSQNEHEKHDVARRGILLALPGHDIDYVADTTYLFEAWSLLVSKYLPSRNAEIRDLYNKLSGQTQSGRPMNEHIDKCMLYKNQLKALGAPYPDEMYVQRLLEVDQEYAFLRPTLTDEQPEKIVASLMQHFRYLQSLKPPTPVRGFSGRGFHRHGHRGAKSNAPAAVAAVSHGGEQRTCFNCKKVGHLQADCPLLHSEVKKFLARGRGQGRGRGRGRGAGRGGVAAIDHEVVTSIVNNMPGSHSPCLPMNLLVDSGSTISLVFNYELFTEIGVSDLENCTPVGSTPLPIHGKGTIKFQLGAYVDHLGQAHPTDIEIPDVYYVPSSPMNILGCSHIRNYGMHLFTGPDGDVLYYPGMPDQVEGQFGSLEQSRDKKGNPIMSINLGVNRPVVAVTPVDSGTVWTRCTAATDVNSEWSALHTDVAAFSNARAVSVSPEFFVHMSFNHCGDTVMKMMAKAPDLYRLHLQPEGLELGQSGQCQGCHISNQRQGARRFYNSSLTDKATYPGESLFADVAGPITPAGIGGARYILVVVDEFSRYCHVFAMKTKSQCARLLAQLSERVRMQIIRGSEPGVRRLHTDQGGEFKSISLQEFCAWRGIIHTFTDTACHQSNGVVERMIGHLTDRVRASLLRAGLPHYLWPEAFMCAAHAHNLLPSPALAKPLDKSIGSKRKKVWQKKKQADQGDQPEGGNSLAFDIRKAIPYLCYHRDVSDESFADLVLQMKPWGVKMVAYPRRDALRHLEERGVFVYFMGPGPGTSMVRAFLRNQAGGKVKAFRHHTVPAAFIEQHAERLLIVAKGAEHLEPQPEFAEYEQGTMHVAERNLTEVEPFSDPDFIAELRDISHYDQIRAAPPDPDGAAVAVRGQHVPEHCGEHPDLGELNNIPGRELHNMRRPESDIPEGTPLSPMAYSAMLISRHANRGTPEVAFNVRAATNERARRLSEPDMRPDAPDPPQSPISDIQSPRAEAYGATLVYEPPSVHRDRACTELGAAGIFPPVAERGLMPPEGVHTPSSSSSMSDRPDQRDLRSNEPVPPPQSAATGVAGPLRGLRGAADSGIPEGVPDLMGQQGAGQEVASGSGGAEADPAEVGRFLRPPDEVRAPAAPLRRNPLIRKRLVPVVAAMDCAGGDAAADLAALNLNDTPRQDACEQEGMSIVESAVDWSEDVSAEADCVTSDAEKTAPTQVSPVGGKTARRIESRRVAAARKRAAAFSDEPTLNQAMKCIHRERWLEAMLEELASLSEHGVFELCELPAGAVLVTGKWVLKIKRGAQGEIERFKARYVARGFTQIYGIDFFETWAPVGRYATLRCLLAVCVREELETRHVDIKCAFLNGKLEEDVYVEQPKVLNDGTHHVWRLKKALYGLKQAAREWHKALAALLHDLDFVRAACDPALYVCKHNRCFVFLWVDDLLIFTTNKLMQPLVDKILRKFKGRSIGELDFVLGMEVIHDKRNKTITITHRRMISDLLQKHGMLGCRHAPTPMVPKQKLLSLKEDPTQVTATVSEHKTFMQAVGGIQYIAVVTRPDLAFAAHSLARHMAGSAKGHWLAAQHVMRYLQKTMNFGLQFKGSGESSVVEAYTDADFANAKSLKSVSGTLVRMYENCVFWRSKRQEIIAGDTTEAELIAMSATANELMWIKQLCTDLSISAQKPVLWGDNKSANLLAANPISSDRSKHIRVRHLRVREAVELDEMEVQWIGTKEMLADGLTKVLAGPALSDMRDKLHLVDVGPAPKLPAPCGGVS